MNARAQNRGSKAHSPSADSRARRKRAHAATAPCLRRPQNSLARDRGRRGKPFGRSFPKAEQISSTNAIPGRLVRYLWYSALESCSSPKCFNQASLMFCLECGGAPAKVQYVEVEEEDEVEKDAAVETEETDSAMAQAGT
eukprot:CAMPEP_0180662300 /NCGR_PEP_ID=MMETSP1037_2-20121125/59316_1 /TAXON_ID=632150 /ORGANISM="Azadinium spinosum, Strain 3D9" /LENGTH=139 /DNA_ID=CAMNT_0022689949 /DNA_START=231 /DNA_END=647 /DNA_ORIENTATION=+